MGPLLLDRTILLSAVRQAGRILRRALGAVAVLGLVAFVALYAFTFTDRFRDFARREVLEAIRGSFRGQITVERLDGSVWGDLQLANVSLQYGGVEVVRVPHARLRYQLLPLLHGELRFTDVEVDEPVVDLHRDEKGSWNLGAALSTPPRVDETSKVAVPRVVIDTLHVSGGKISVTPCRAQSTCLLEDVALGARLEAESARVDADIQSVSLRLAVEGLPLFWAEGSLRYQGAESPPWAEIRQLAVVTQQSRATLRGKVENLIDFRAARSDLVLTIDGLAPGDVSTVAPESAPSEWLGRLDPAARPRRRPARTHRSHRGARQHPRRRPRRRACHPNEGRRRDRSPGARPRSGRQQGGDRRGRERTARSHAAGDRHPSGDGQCEPADSRLCVPAVALRRPHLVCEPRGRPRGDDGNAATRVGRRAMERRRGARRCAAVSARGEPHAFRSKGLRLARRKRRRESRGASRRARLHARLSNEATSSSTWQLRSWEPWRSIAAEPILRSPTTVSTSPSSLWSRATPRCGPRAMSVSPRR